MITDTEFFRYLEEECNIKLTKEQREAVVTLDCPISLISTAGSGKTSVVTAKVAYLILVKGMAPSKILVTSFSNQSATDMEDRFVSRFGGRITEKVPFSTIHSFAFAVFRDYARRLNMQYIIIEDSNSPMSKSELLSNLYRKYTKEIITEDKLKELSGFVSFIKNLMIMYADLDKYEEQFPVPCFKDIYREYEEIKRNYLEEGRGKIRLLDFDDMLSMCYHILKKNPSMLQEYRGKYDYYIVDEAQDTSLIQNAIIRLISYPKHNLFMVGDPRQSIYSWRGAVVEELINFQDRYPNAKVLYMNRNFRSTKTIVDASTEFIKIQKDNLDNNIYTENEQGETIKFVATEDEFAQIDYILNKIKYGKKLSEIAVIYRNNISAVPLVKALTRRGIPYYIKDEVNSFFNHWVTLDILNFFEFSKAQWNVDIFSSIYYKIRSYISKKDMESLLSFNVDDKSVFDRLAENPNYKNQNDRLMDFKIKFEMLSEMKPREAIEYIESDLNYKKYLSEYATKFNYSMEGINNTLATLKIVAADLESISDFEDEIKSLQSSMTKSKYNRNENAVTLTSSHSSKGLEWDEVFFIDTQNIPSSDSLNKLSEGENSPYYEEARVFFVSITRAKKLLHVMYPRFRNGQKIESSAFYKTFKNIVAESMGENVTTSKEKTKNLPIPKLEEGTTIKHKKWGEGNIVNIDEDIITVAFHSGFVKKLSISVCCNEGLIF